MHPPCLESVTTVRVNYSETDQMGVVYHARHVVWLDIARTELLRLAGYSYRELEESGVRLVVTDLGIRYRSAARYDDVIRIRCRVRDAASRRVTFAYQLENAETGMPIADAETTLLSLDREHRPTRLPAPILVALGGAARSGS
ncbi:MAG: acyl-CoA thioesterase [Gemmatimonadales bacterium]|nr:MAG: acyl-CoA thioesterase [Gemmatimonadales bacterium]